MKSDILIIKGENYNDLIEKAASKLGLNGHSFMRLASIEKAKKVLGEDK